MSPFHLLCVEMLTPDAEMLLLLQWLCICHSVGQIVLQSCNYVLYCTLCWTSQFCSTLWSWNILQYSWNKSKMPSLLKGHLPGGAQEYFMQTMPRRNIHQVTGKQDCGGLLA